MTVLVVGNQQKVLFQADSDDVEQENAIIDDINHPYSSVHKNLAMSLDSAITEDVKDTTLEIQPKSILKESSIVITSASDIAAGTETVKVEIKEQFVDPW